MDLALRQGQDWVVPPPRETHDAVMEDGHRIRLRRHGNPDGPRLVVAHGNGLATDAYVMFWGPLLDRYDVIVFDQRHHGWNADLNVPNLAHHDWAWVVRDQKPISDAIAAAWGAKPAAGVFHSLSAVANLKRAATIGPLWDVMVLFDPPIYPRDGHPLQRSERECMDDFTRKALKRREVFNNPAELAAQMAPRREFSRWLPGAHLLYARSILRYDEAGQVWRLRCPREAEAVLFDTNVDGDLWHELSAIDRPFMLIGGDPDCPDATPPAPTNAAIHAELGVPYAMIPDTTHFLQLERPEPCIAAMEGFLARHGLKG